MPRSVVEDAADNPFGLIVAVREFVEAMVSQGLYRSTEISPKAMQACHADDYLAEVNNGGHSQFIYNSGEELDTVIADARTALAEMGAHGQLATLDQMAAWVAEHPEETEEQTGFEGGTDDKLSTLDRLFYQADQAASMLALSARWINSWPELAIVEDADYGEAIHQLAVTNPRREPRLLHRSVGKLVNQMTGWRDVGVGLACAEAPRPEVKLALGMARVLDVEGEKLLAFQLRTNAKEPRLAVATPAHAAVYEYIAPEDPSVARPGENPFAAGAPRVGKRLGRVEAQAIEMVLELAAAYHAPVAVDLLLRRAGFDPTDAVVSANSVVPREGGAVVNWVVMADEYVFLLQSTPKGGVLRGTHEESLAEADRRELEEYFDQAAAAGA
ncbi:DMP19 family protein [Mesorhizobium sp. M0119]|uniref:DMP19 family protein n=1 Tax=unclassified Mesorhizobium TaxID=325217 RepID=UPI003337BB31